MEKKENNKQNKQSKEFDWEIGMVVILMLIIVVLPIAISVLDIGMPIKGYNA
jgi:flagellar biosynthesis component FlhA